MTDAAPENVRTMPLDELKQRVEEAERLLRTARQLARDELSDPERCDRARDRISSLIAEAQSLFPGLGGAEPESTDVAEDGDAEDHGADEDQAAAADEDANEDGGEDADEDGDEDAEEDADEDEEEWDVDVVKLASAIRDENLMAKIPEAHRAEFKAMAERLIDAHERHALYERVSNAFEELDHTAREGAEHTRRLLAAALTFEQLGAKYKA